MHNFCIIAVLHATHLEVLILISLQFLISLKICFYIHWGFVFNIPHIHAYNYTYLKIYWLWLTLYPSAEYISWNYSPAHLWEECYRQTVKEYNRWDIQGVSREPQESLAAIHGKDLLTLPARERPHCHAVYIRESICNLYKFEVIKLKKKKKNCMNSLNSTEIMINRFKPSYSSLTSYFNNWPLIGCVSRYLLFIQKYIIEEYLYSRGNVKQASDSRED